MAATGKSYHCGLLPRKLQRIKSYWCRVMAGVVKGSRVCRGMCLWFRLKGRIKWLVAVLGFDNNGNRVVVVMGCLVSLVVMMGV